MASSRRPQRVVSDDEGSKLDSDSSVNTDVDSEPESELDEDSLNPTWSNATSGLRRFDFTKEDGLLVPIPGENTPADWFFLLLDEPFLEEICKETNKYALELFCGPSTSINSRIANFKDITVAELKTFIGLLLHSGTIRLNRLQDYWKTNRLFNLPLFREHMSRDRFLIILRCLHFSSPPRNVNEDVTRLHKIEKVVDYFNNKMQAVYYPTRELSLDEAMVLWRGRLAFRQYIKGKHHKYGIKLYSLNEPHGLTMRFLIYSGKEGDLSGKGHTSKVVFRLMNRYLYNGHSLYMDNFYNSFSLAARLLSKNTYCTGTLRSNRKHNPADVISAKLKKGEMITRYAEGVMIGKWRDKRTVLYLSTQFENTMVTSENKRNQEKQKPLPVVQYNAHMKGVDRHDQLMLYYPCERKTLRWYKKIFIHVLQMIVVNSMILYNTCNIDNKMTLYDFRLAIIESLLPPKERPPVILSPRNPTHSSIKNEDRDSRGDRKRKDCRQCYKAEKKRKMTTFTCTACPDKPGLCAGKCFDDYHKNMNERAVASVVAVSFIVQCRAVDSSTPGSDRSHTRGSATGFTMATPSSDKGCFRKLSDKLTCRQVLNIMVFFGFMVNYMLRVNLTIAIVDMVVPSNTTKGGVEVIHSECVAEAPFSNVTVEPLSTLAAPVDHGIRFDWDAKEQNMIIGSFFWGYICTELPGGRLAEMVGARRVFGYSMLTAAIITLITPLATRVGYVAVVITRVVLGFMLGATWPSMQPMAAQWIPPNERSKFISNMMASSLGAAITLPVCGFLIAHFGWESVFYVTGLVGLVWAIMWFLVVFDHPADHPRISPQERQYIESELGTSSTSSSHKALQVPWKSILTSPPVWAIIITHGASVFGYFTVVNQLPTYMKYILAFNIKENGLLSSLPYFGKYVMAITTSSIADYLRSSGRLSTTAIRKLFTAFAVMVPGILMIGQVFLGCDRVGSIVIFTTALTVNGAVTAGYLGNGLDIAPNYSGTIFGMANTLSSFGGWLSAYMVGLLTYQNQTYAQWKIVFWILVGTYTVGGLMFLIFGTGELQSWNTPGGVQSRKPDVELQNVKEKKEAVPLRRDSS